ncbi:type II toxin-antitoxin system VapB family antitoxin [Bradyrhizobium yuanmingense]|nr:type II toxin-antitoxin system VapB family antitoxin [Bradyrhizobium yuanmingense]
MATLASTVTFAGVKQRRSMIFKSPSTAASASKVRVYSTDLICLVKGYVCLGRRFEMSLNLGSAQARKLAAELARRTGETRSIAVATAIREWLERVRREQGESLADRLLTIGQDCAKRLKKPHGSVDNDDSLYDERGLPR